MNPLELGKQSNPGRQPQGGAARLVNIYAAEGGKDQTVEWPLFAASGLADLVTLTGGTGGIRALLPVDEYLYAIAGRSVMKIGQDLTFTELGGVSSDGIVTMARNGRQTGPQIGIVVNGEYYLIDDGTLELVEDEDLPAPNSIFYLGGYFFFTHSSGRYSWTDLENGAEIDGLDYNTASANPDGLLIGKARGRDAVLLGVRSTEIRTMNDGTGDDPLSVRSVLDYGCFAAGSAVSLNDTVMWASTNADGAFAGMRMLEGDTPREFGTDAINRIVARETPDNITGSTWVEDGRTHIAWSGDDWTWVYDLKTGLWHERSSNQTRWRASHVAQFGGNIVAGDAENAKLYRMSRDIFDDAGSELVVTVQPPPLIAFPGRIEVSELHLHALTGIGAATGDDHDITPEVSMQWSNDGETWSTELRRGLGRRGAMRGRVIWNRLGTQPETGRTYRLMMSAKVARTLFSASWDGKVLPP